jgi:hypothetical protein
LYILSVTGTQWTSEPSSEYKNVLLETFGWLVDFNEKFFNVNVGLLDYNTKWICM